MLFAKDPLIIELLPETMLEPYFYNLSQMMEYEYEGIVTAAVNDDLIVDVDSLSDRLDALGID